MACEMIRPDRLRPGDRVAAATPSWGGPATFPHRFEAGKRQLADAFGVEVVELPHTRADADWLAARPEARAEDLHRALADPGIAGIVTSIGGDDAIRVVQCLDLDVVRANPKPLLGYSDATALHLAWLRAGVTSVYGPAIMAGFGENAGLHDYLVQGVRRTLFEPEAPLVWPENHDGWTVEFLDWADPANQDRPRQLRPATGWRWLQGDRPAEGRLVVGCVDALLTVRGTPWWPDLDGAVLALETAEEGMPPDHLARFLRSLVASGELQRVAAVLFGRPGGADVPVEAHGDYDAALLRVMAEAGRTDAPVVAGMDFGHTDPMWPLPLGVPTRVDPERREVVFLEAGVR